MLMLIECSSDAAVAAATAGRPKLSTATSDEDSSDDLS